LELPRQRSCVGTQLIRPTCRERIHKSL
jgi:hypothetical protein